MRELTGEQRVEWLRNLRNEYSIAAAAGFLHSIQGEDLIEEYAALLGRVEETERALAEGKEFAANSWASVRWADDAATTGSLSALEHYRLVRAVMADALEWIATRAALASTESPATVDYTMSEPEPLVKLAEIAAVAHALAEKVERGWFIYHPASNNVMAEYATEAEAIEGLADWDDCEALSFGDAPEEQTP